MKSKKTNLLVTIYFIVFSLCFILPFVLIISSSLTEEQALLENGYQLIPSDFSFDAYQFIMRSPGQMLNSYKVTILYSLIGTVLSMIVMTLMAYPLSRSNYKYKKQVTFFVIFTMLFSGGLIPTYILMTKYLHLQDNIWVYILPNLANAFHIIVIRSFFQGLPPSLVESAKIDGASELKVFCKIVIPLSKPVIATVSLLNLLSRWNDWNTALIYIRSKELYSLQYLLQQILREVQFIKDMAESSPVAGINVNLTQLPSETIRFAMCIVAAGPMLIIFPFFQKYFAKGLTVGAVKE